VLSTAVLDANLRGSIAVLVLTIADTDDSWRESAWEHYQVGVSGESADWRGQTFAMPTSVPAWSGVSVAPWV
jgi:hypothetical protein